MAERQNFSTRMAARILAISPGRIRYWVRRKLVKPAAVRGRHYQFTFEDLLMLRLAKELLPNRRRLEAVQRCFERVGRITDTERPVTALKLYEADGRILVREGAVTFEAETGRARAPADRDQSLLRRNGLLGAVVAPDPQRSLGEAESPHAD